MSEFSLKTPTQEPELDTALKVIYQWNYKPEVEELRRLYVMGVESQWNGSRDLDWDQPIDMEAFAATPVSSSIPIEKTSYWKSLDQETRWEMTKKGAGFRLSNFLHGEQGALMVAAQLVNAVPHTDAKFYAATQTMDEARHVEVFARYIDKLDIVRPIAPALKGVLDATLATDSWLKKLVGMQLVVEGLALFSFRRMRSMTSEPLLKQLLTYVSRDESRHHAYGVKYIERCVPCLGAAELEELEEFALEAAQTLVGNANEQGLLAALLESWREVGIDIPELFACVQRERDMITRDTPEVHRLGPVTGFVVPTLRRCGLLSDRIAGRFHEFLAGTMSREAVGERLEDFLKKIPELPEDTAAWVLSEIN